MNIALARLLGRSAFGAYAVVLGSVQNVALLASLAMALTATRYLAEARVQDRLRAGRVLGFCLAVTMASASLGGIGLLVFAGPLAHSVLHDPSLAPLLRVAGGTAPFVILNGTFMGVLAGLGAYRRLGLTNIAAGLLYIALSLGGATAWGVSGATVGLLASALLQSVLLGLAVRAEARRHAIQPVFRLSGGERRIVTRFAVPSAIAGISYAAAVWAGQLLLARRPGGYVELAGYVAAFNLITVVLFLPNVTNTVGSSFLNSITRSRRGTDYPRVFWFNFRLTLTGAAGGATVIALLGSRLLGLYGPSFVAVVPVLLLLALGSVPESLITALNQVLQSRERMWEGVWGVILPRDVLFLAGGWVLTARAGAYGLAGAYLGSRLVGMVLAMLMVRGYGVPGAAAARPGPTLGEEG